MTQAYASPGWTEDERVAALRRYGILDTPAEKSFDDLVRLASELLGAPIAAVNLIDRERQWFKSEVGLHVRQMPLDDSTCKFALLETALMVVPDAREDARFACNPLVARAGGLRFYAGAVLRSSDGFPLGTLCVLDVAPRLEGLSAHHAFVLQTLADQVVSQMELRRMVAEQDALLAQKDGAERALRDSESLLQSNLRTLHAERNMLDALLTALPVGIAYADHAGKLVLYNDEMSRVWGPHPVSENVGAYAEWQGWWADHSPRHGQPVLADEWAQARALRGEYVEGDIVEIRPFGERDEHRTVIIRGAPVRDDDGAIAGSVTAVTDVTRERAAERALRISEERFRTFVQATAQIVWMADASGMIVEDSPTWSAYTGQTFDEWTGRGWLDAVHPDDRQHARDVWLASVRDARPYEVEYRVRSAQGAYRWTVARGHPIRRADGAVREWVGTNTDIHDRRLAESALEEWRARLAFILEAADIGTWSVDATSDTVHADANVAAMFGVVRGADGSAPLDAFTRAIHPDDRQAVEDSLRAAVTRGTPHHIVHRILRADGSELTVNARGRAEVDETGGAVRVAGVVLDITRQVETEQRLRHSEQALVSSERRYRTVLDSIDEGFCIIEMLYDGPDDGSRDPADYRILETNPAFTAHTGLRDAAGRTIRELIPTHDIRWSRLYGRVARTGEALRTQEYTANLGRWLEIYAAPVGDPERRQVAVFLRDVTNERQRNEALQRLADDLAGANRRQSEFLATLAHELRNPLAPVRTGLDLLRIGAGKPDILAKVRPMLERQIDHLISLVDDLLDLARIASGKIELKKADVVLKDVVLRAVEMASPLIESKRHAFRLDIDDDAVRVHADATRLAQIVGNLLTNAAKYTLDGGAIALRTVTGERDVEIVVADTGIGIPADALPRIFDMFTQVGRHPEQEHGGLGIGLHLVRQMTELHGGSVHAASAGPGTGSSFTIRLPRLDAAPACADALASAHIPERRALRILLVDDNADAVELLRDVLDMEGHAVRTAHGGEAALAVAAAFRPDLAFVDIGMPGMSGYEVAQRLRALPELDGLKLVAVTGWGTDDDRARSRAAGFDGHLTKPVGLHELFEAIAACR